MESDTILAADNSNATVNESNLPLQLDTNTIKSTASNNSDANTDQSHVRVIDSDSDQSSTKPTAMHQVESRDIDQSEVTVTDLNSDQSSTKLTALHQTKSIDVDQSDVTVIDANCDQSNSKPTGMHQTESIDVDQSDVTVIDGNFDQSISKPTGMHQTESIDVDQSDVTVIDANCDQSNSKPTGMHQTESIDVDQSDVTVIDGNFDQSNSKPTGMHQTESIDVDQSDVTVIDAVCDQSNSKPTGMHQSEDCILMEYRKGGARRGDADSSSSTSSGDESSDDEHDATDTKINKAISQVRDESPESNRRVRLNRHGFEDLRTKGELLPEELPPLEELCITVDESVKMVAVGTIKSVIGVLVVIQSNANVPALDDETILFVEGHKVLGQVFEVFGPVTAPWYSVRFNQEQNIAGKDLAVGMAVYCAPTEESFTKYVFMDSLRKMRGSDASWEDNNEPPDKFLDYSDDEAERQAKNKKKKKRRRDGEPAGGSQETGNQNRPERGNNSDRQWHPRDERNGPRQEFGGRANRNPFHGPDSRGSRPRFSGGPPDRFCEPNTRTGRSNYGPEGSGGWGGPDADGGWGDHNRQQAFHGRPPTNFGGPPQFNAPNFNNNNNNNRNQRPPRPPPEAFQNFGNSNVNFSSGSQFNTCHPRMPANTVRPFSPPPQGQGNTGPHPHLPATGIPPPPANQFNRPPPPMFSQPPPLLPNAAPFGPQAPPPMPQALPLMQHAPTSVPQAPPAMSQNPPLMQQAPPSMPQAPHSASQAPPSTRNSGSGQIPPLMGGNRFTPPPVLNGQNTNSNSNPCPSCKCNVSQPQTGQLNPPQTTNGHQNIHGTQAQSPANTEQQFSNANTSHQPRPGFVGGSPANQPPPLMSQTIGRFASQTNNAGINLSNSGPTCHNPTQVANSGNNQVPPWVNNQSAPQSQKPMLGGNSVQGHGINTWEQGQTMPQNNYNNCLNSQNNMNTFTQPSAQNLNSNFQNQPPWKCNAAVQNVNKGPGQSETCNTNQFMHNMTGGGNQNNSIVDRRYIQNNE